MKQIRAAKLVTLLLLTSLAISCNKDKKTVTCFITTRTTSSSGSASIDSYTYNSSNQITNWTVSGASSATYSFSYDSKGLVTTRTFVSGSTIIIRSYTYDSNNRLILESTNTGSTTSYAYNSSGQVTTVVFSDGSQSVFTYSDTSSKNWSSETYSPNGGSAVVYTYTYDNKVNPYKKVAAFQPSTQADNNVTLVTGSGSSTTYTYQYNSDGYPTSRISSSGTTTSLSYDCK